MTRERRLWLVLFTGVAIAGVIFRIAVIDESFWYDEAVSATRFFPRSLIGIVAGEAHPNNHPLYSVLVHGFWWFSESEALARLPSLLAWIGLVAVVFLLARRVFTEAVGWTAAMLMVLSFWPLRYSIEARGYMLAASLGTLAVYLVVIGLEDERPDRLWFGAMVLALAGFAHLYAATLLVSVLTVWVGIQVRGRSDLRSAAIGFGKWSAGVGAGVFVLYLPSLYIVRVLAGMVSSGAGGTAFTSTPSQPFTVEYATALTGAQIAGTGSAVGLAVVLVPWGIAAYTERRNRPALSLIVAPLVLCVSAAILGLVYFPRFFIVVQPLVAIAVGAGLVRIARGVGRNVWWAVPALSAMLVVAATLGPGGGFPTLPIQARGWDDAADYALASGLTVVANPIDSGWSPVRGALGYYLDQPLAVDPTDDLQVGQRVVYVRLFGGAEEKVVDVTVGDPIEFGEVSAYLLEWTGQALVPAEE